MKGRDFEIHVLCGSTNFHVVMKDEFDKWEAMRRAVDRVAREYHAEAEALEVVGCRAL